MKRSKLFLGVTTTCLAIAGVVAAKVNYWGSISAYYYTSGGRCITGLAPCMYKSGTANDCKSLAGVTYYTKKVGAFECGAVLTFTIP